MPFDVWVLSAIPLYIDRCTGRLEKHTKPAPRDDRLTIYRDTHNIILSVCVLRAE